MNRAAIILGAIAAWSAVAPPFAFARTPTMACTEAHLTQPYQPYNYQDHDNADPERACSALDNICFKTNDNRPAAQNPDISLCNLAYEQMREAARNYAQAVSGSYCQEFTTLYSSCTGSQAALLSCHQSEDQRHAAVERALAAKLRVNKTLAREWLTRLTKMSANFAAYANNPASARVGCGTKVSSATIPATDFRSSLATARSQISALQSRITGFESALGTSITKHGSQQTNFQTMAAAAAKSVRNVASTLGPEAAGKAQNDPKSDITGTEKEEGSQGQQQQQQGAGAGGSPSGGSPSGSQSGSAGDAGNALAAGAGPGDSGAPSVSSTSARTGAGTGTSNGNSFRANGSGNSTAGVVARSDAAKPVVAAPFTYSAGGPGFSSESGTGTSAANSAFGAGYSSQPSRSGGSSGGASGGGGASAGGSSLGSACSGKDCQAASGSGMFGGVGALGSGSPSSGGGGESGGMASLGGLDSAGSLDNLFKDDKNKAVAPGADALGGMADLDATTAGLEAGSADGTTQASGDIGSEDGDLFTRLHQFHERAQKRGMVVGLTRKL